MTRYFLTLAATLLVSCTLASQAQTKTVLRSPNQRSPAFAGQLTPYVAPGPYNRGAWDFYAEQRRYARRRTQPWGSCTYRGGPKTNEWSC